MQFIENNSCMYTFTEYSNFTFFMICRYTHFYLKSGLNNFFFAKLTHCCLDYNHYVYVKLCIKMHPMLNISCLIRYNVSILSDNINRNENKS